ncbi:hypothetical protein MMC13_004766 [Lambiella insularis]|nr:hypothetical protein [Lambiella insularis]
MASGRAVTNGTVRVALAAGPNLKIAKDGMRRTWFPKELHEDPRMQNVRVILPTAAERRVTLWSKEGKVINAWFDIPTWNDIVWNVNDEPGMIRAAEWLDGAIDEEIGGGIPAQSIFVGGFSQGGSLALLAGLSGRHGHHLGGILALSAYLPMIQRVRELDPEARLNNSCKDLPFLICHGNGDPQVKWNWGDRSQKAIKELGCTSVDFKTYRGLFHDVCQEEVDDFKEWWARLVVPETSNMKNVVIAAVRAQDASASRHTIENCTTKSLKSSQEILDWMLKKQH